MNRRKLPSRSPTSPTLVITSPNKNDSINDLDTLNSFHDDGNNNNNNDISNHSNNNISDGLNSQISQIIF